MISAGPVEARCANAGCSRPPEEAERFCATCGLERALFHRDARREVSESRPPEGPEKSSDRIAESHDW